MASRVKEDEKNERIIRGLLKLQENRRCINCNSLGPQYVCTNFSTFVCTTCSGIHREFTHRVKSISMAKFTPQEVGALQEGGNKILHVIYYYCSDFLPIFFFGGSNVDRLRDFIKHVYVDKRYTGDKNYGKPPIMKTVKSVQADREDVGSRSPPYEDVYDRRSNERSSPGGRSDDKNYRYGYDERRSPGYDQEGRHYSDYRKSPARPEIINDWRREDRFGNGRKGEDHRVSDGDSKLSGRSPERPNDVGGTSPPVVRPVREILGDSVVPLRISEPPKANAVRTADGFVGTQRTASSSSLSSTTEAPAEVKVEPAPSLIDFDSDPAPTAAAAAPQAQQTTSTQPAAPTLAASNDNNWASFDFAPAPKASEAPANASPLDSVLSQLSATPSVPGPTQIIPNGFGTMPVTGNGGNAPVPEAGQWATTQHQQPSLTPAQSTSQQYSAPGNHLWNSSLPPNVQAALNTTPGGGTIPGPGSSQSSTATGMKELPQDLFTATYPYFPTMVPGWQTGPPRGMMYPMQYSNVPAPMQYANVPSPMQYANVPSPMQYNSAAALMPTFIQQPSKSLNPFDANEPTPAQAQPFPNMSSLQSALPNMAAHSGIQRASSLDNSAPPAWMPNQSSPYQSGLHPQLQSYSTTAPPRPTTSQVPSHSSGHLGIAGFGSSDGGAAFGALNLDQHLAGGFSAPATTLQPFPSAGGNPFG
ncbi:unnamed protein product [Linum tenue]|uniref:Arf-GAP domain-containing protein n=1 Tax=Linum tenue TaxID=586396 RepID=A0AAV0HXB8_9ROSI|nr:unnamed protein product [Linum tenue]